MATENRFNLRLKRVVTGAEIEAACGTIGVDPRGVEIMAPKGVFVVLQAQGLKPHAATILKQEMLAKGGEAAIPRHVYDGAATTADVLLMGTKAQYLEVCRTLAEEPFGLAALGREIGAVIARMTIPPPAIAIGGREFIWGRRTFLMGIINATPDSFSGDGLQGTADPTAAAVSQAKAMVAAGADLLDIGAESTRPGAGAVTTEEELARLLPILRAVAESVSVPISVDTYKAAVAEAALKCGASCLNDVWGLQREAGMAEVAARARVPVILMHNQSDTAYRDLMGDIISFLRRSIALAVSAGLPEDMLIIDPGIGFGKTREQNLAALRDLCELRSLGRPILLGTSRKSVVGLTLDLPVGERAFGTAATVAMGIAGGADIVRVHDVREMAQVARMTDAIVRGETG